MKKLYIIIMLIICSSCHQSYIESGNPCFGYDPVKAVSNGESTRLRLISCSNMNWDSLFNELSTYKNIKSIEIEGPGYVYLPPSIVSLSMETFYLDCRGFQSKDSIQISPEFSNITTLHTVSITPSADFGIPDYCTNSYATTIYLCDIRNSDINYLSQLLDRLSGYSKAKRLIFMDCDTLDKLPSSIKKWASLKRIVFHNTNLREFGDEIFISSKVEILDFDNSVPPASIPESAGLLKRKLYIGGGDVKALKKLNEQNTSYSNWKVIF